jgi:acetyl esterase/lipase
MHRFTSHPASGCGSAGGGLALASALRLKELKVDLPAAAYGNIPWAQVRLGHRAWGCLFITLSKE